MNQLETRLKNLENLVSSLLELNNADAKIEMMDNAKVMAIYSIVQELAEKAGIPPDSFLKHYETRFRWWHDYYLRQAEDISPARAAALDPRTSGQCAVDATYPPIFDPPPFD